jgi:hypothetical protein
MKKKKGSLVITITSFINSIASIAIFITAYNLGIKTFLLVIATVITVIIHIALREEE